MAELAVTIDAVLVDRIVQSYREGGSIIQTGLKRFGRLIGWLEDDVAVGGSFAESESLLQISIVDYLKGAYARTNRSTAADGAVREQLGVADLVQIIDGIENLRVDVLANHEYNIICCFFAGDVGGGSIESHPRVVKFNTAATEVYGFTRVRIWNCYFYYRTACVGAEDDLFRLYSLKFNALFFASVIEGFRTRPRKDIVEFLSKITTLSESEVLKLTVSDMWSFLGGIRDDLIGVGFLGSGDKVSRLRDYIRQYDLNNKTVRKKFFNDISGWIECSDVSFPSRRLLAFFGVPAKGVNSRVLARIRSSFLDKLYDVISAIAVRYRMLERYEIDFFVSGRVEEDVQKFLVSDFRINQESKDAFLSLFVIELQGYLPKNPIKGEWGELKKTDRGLVLYVNKSTVVSADAMEMELGKVT